MIPECPILVAQWSDRSRGGVFTDERGRSRPGCQTVRIGVRVAEPQVLPEVDALSEPFWRSGADGMLRFQRCQACDWWIHTPKPRCPRCMSDDIRYDPVSGNAEVWSFTVNHQAWSPDLEVPYAIAIVEFPSSTVCA